MPEVEIEIKGLKELAKNIDSLGKNFARSTLRTALRGGAKPVVRLAKAKAPYRTGRLRRDIRAVVSVKRDGYGTALVGWTSAAAHGIFAELGTSKLPARPFLRPALDEAESKGDVLEGFIMALNKTIEKRLARGSRR